MKTPEQITAQITQRPTLSAARVPGGSTTRTVYKLSAPTRTAAYAADFDHVVLSLGRDGDTCVFPSDAEGRILNLVGFGFAMGPDRWLTDSEFDAYVQACIEQHEKDGGEGLTFYTEKENASCERTPSR